MRADVLRGDLAEVLDECARGAGGEARPTAGAPARALHVRPQAQALLLLQLALHHQPHHRPLLPVPPSFRLPQRARLLGARARRALLARGVRVERARGGRSGRAAGGVRRPSGLERRTRDGRTRAQRRGAALWRRVALDRRREGRRRGRRAAALVDGVREAREAATLDAGADGQSD